MARTRALCGPSTAGLAGVAAASAPGHGQHAVPEQQAEFLGKGPRLAEVLEHVVWGAALLHGLRSRTRNTTAPPSVPAIATPSRTAIASPSTRPRLRASFGA